MSPLLEWTLVGWSLLAMCWWSIAIWLVSGERNRSGRLRRAVRVVAPTTRPTVSIFKPIAALHDGSPSPALIAAMESFVSQLDDRAEMLLGIEDRDAAKWKPVVERWQRKFPRHRLKPVIAPRPAQFLSPKVSWFQTLSEHATGEYWMWSDTDIVAPPGFLDAMRRELMDGGAGLVTCPYVIRNVELGPMILEALFANVEFYPGVLFCRRTGLVQFGLGAGMMFPAARFRERANWAALGARLADDNALGRALAPIRVSRITMETHASESNWAGAIQHYMRWQKTVRWCSPAGFAGLALIVPALGWLAAILTHPGCAVAWLGLILTTQMEILTAAVLFWLIGCELPPWWAACFWSVLVRPLAWLACWVPWPVVFRSQNRKWWSLYRSVPLEGEI
jgi:ceramide glucosyltransferase